MHLSMRSGHLPTVSAREMVVLELLLQRDELDGRELVVISGGRLARGGLSAVLRRLEAKGLVAGRAEELRRTAGRTRRLFHATAAGRRLFELWAMVRQQLSRIPA
jgi:DNA-binding PadR family transcriptional regulator